MECTLNKGQIQLNFEYPQNRTREALYNERDGDLLNSACEITLIGEFDDHIMNIVKSTNSFYEAQLLEHLKEIVRERGFFIDIGAHIGNHSIFFGKILGLNGLALEPEAKNFRNLRRNIRKNNLQDSVKIMKVAAAKAKGVGRATRKSEGNSGMSQFHQGVGKTKAIPVDCLVDQSNIDHLRLVKIDIEGMELDALIGMENILRQGNPVLCVEIQTKNDFDEICEFLDKFNFSTDGVNRAATPTYVFRKGVVEE
jgi:FkbM family methyltransferase